MASSHALVVCQDHQPSFILSPPLLSFMLVTSHTYVSVIVLLFVQGKFIRTGHLKLHRILTLFPTVFLQRIYSSERLPLYISIYIYVCFLNYIASLIFHSDSVSPKYKYIFVCDSCLCAIRTFFSWRSFIPRQCLPQMSLPPLQLLSTSDRRAVTSRIFVYTSFLNIIFAMVLPFVSCSRVISRSPKVLASVIPKFVHKCSVMPRFSLRLAVTRTRPPFWADTSWTVSLSPAEICVTGRFCVNKLYWYILLILFSAAKLCTKMYFLISDHWRCSLIICSSPNRSSTGIIQSPSNRLSINSFFKQF